MNLKNAKFFARVIFTLVSMTIGAVVFFTAKDTGTQVLGINMITVPWAAWMSAGKVGKARPKRDPEDPEP